jgi:hypothetical protein
LVHICFLFGYVVQIKIWQPCSSCC